MDQTMGDVPPAIPMPNQGTLAQTLATSADPMPSNLAQDSQDKKTFTMNPNAAMFRPYPDQGMQQGQQGQMSHNTFSADGDKGPHADFQSGTDICLTFSFVQYQ